MASSMQGVGQYLARQSRAKGYGIKSSTYVAQAKAEYVRPKKVYRPKTYKTFRTKGTTGKARIADVNPQGAISTTKAAITRALKSGRFAEIPDVGGKGLTLKQNMIEFAEAVKAPPMLVAKLRRMDPNKLYALMTVNQWQIDDFFTYEPSGFDYASAYHSGSWDKIEMVCNQYDRVFGITQQSVLL